VVDDPTSYPSRDSAAAPRLPPDTRSKERYLCVETPEVADDAEHVFTLAHILDKDALECRLVLVELFQSRTHRHPPVSTERILPRAAARRSRLAYTRARMPRRGWAGWAGLRARTSLNWIAPICPSSCSVSCAASLCTNSCTRFISSLRNCDIVSRSPARPKIAQKNADSRRQHAREARQGGTRRRHVRHRSPARLIGPALRRQRAVQSPLRAAAASWQWQATGAHPVTAGAPGAHGSAAACSSGSSMHLALGGPGDRRAGRLPDAAGPALGLSSNACTPSAPSQFGSHAVRSRGPGGERGACVRPTDVTRCRRRRRALRTSGRQSKPPRLTSCDNPIWGAGTYDTSSVAQGSWVYQNLGGRKKKKSGDAETECDSCSGGGSGRRGGIDGGGCERRRRPCSGLRV